MGWDFETYGKQPVWFIRLILAKMNLDSEFNQERIKNANKSG